jgi:Tfp pilus assembly protein PilF
MRGFAGLRRASARSDFETAADEFREALKTAPKSASAWAGLSLALSGQILGPVFLAQRERFHDGLRKAGMPE